MMKMPRRKKIKIIVKAKEVESMVATVSLREDEDIFIKEMKMYIAKLKQGSSQKKAKSEAKKALIRTGVLTEDGKEKKIIVTWE